MVRFLVVGDLHGKLPRIKYKKFDAILAVGDFCSSEPIRSYMFKAFQKRIDNPKSKINWWDMIGKKKTKEEVMKSIKTGKKMIKKLASFKVPVFTVPGNWDWTNEYYNYPFLRKNYYRKIIGEFSKVFDVYFMRKKFKGFDIIGYGEVSGPEYPYYERNRKIYSKDILNKKKKEYDDRLKRISKLFDKIPSNVIFLSHNVPFGTLDKITNEDSPMKGLSSGSLVTRDIIKKHKPLVCVAGHMHENFGKKKIGKTLVINSGFRKNFILEIKNGKVKTIGL